VDPRASLDVCEKSCPHRYFFFNNASFVRILYFVVLVLDLGPLAVAGKFRRLRSGANPRTWVPEASIGIRSPDRPAGSQSLSR
jgi:hypothetical protein